MSRNRQCPECEHWAAEFDPYFKRWRCFWPGCWWMPRSSVEAWREVWGNPRFGGPFPPGAVMSAEGLALGAEYEFAIEAGCGRWVRSAVRTFAGSAGEFGPDDATLADIGAPTGARLEFTHHATAGRVRCGGGDIVAFWDGGAKDGCIAAGHLLGEGATIAVVPVSAGGGAGRRVDDNLRRVFG